MSFDEKFKTAKPGDQLNNDTYFLGWGALEERGETAIKCPHCGGFAGNVKSTSEEVNCGRFYACCCAAFRCDLCKRRWVTYATRT